MKIRRKRGTRLGVGESRAAVIGIGMAAWVIGALWIFPVAWTVFTSFKSEQDASAQTLQHGLSLSRYSEVSHSFEQDKVANIEMRLLCKAPVRAVARQ